jgi:2-haloacid dehalogenase
VLRATADTDDRAQTGVRAVVFDLGGVLVDWDPRHLYRRLFAGDEAGMEAFLSNVCNAEWNAELDAGRPWADAISDLTERHPAQRELIEAYRLRWAEMLAGPVQPTVDILDELRATGVRLFALSNWSAETLPIARSRFEFFGWFEALVISGELGLCKPDPRIFRHLLQAHGLEPRSTVFIDDHARNVEAAAALAFDAIHYTDPARLRADLVSRGLVLARA